MEDHGRETGFLDRVQAAVNAGASGQGQTSTGASEAKPKMHEFASGAKSTVVKPRYDLIPQIAMELLAERFAYGAGRHGERNYRKGGQDPVFVTDRVNHLIEHVMQFAEHRRRADLAAILCNAAILADVNAFVEGATEPTISEQIQTALRAEYKPSPNVCGGGHR